MNTRTDWPIHSFKLPESAVNVVVDEKEVAYWRYDRAWSALTAPLKSPD